MKHCLKTALRIVAITSLIILTANITGCDREKEQNPGLTNITASDTELIITCSAKANEVSLLELAPFQEYKKSQNYTPAWQGRPDRQITIPRYENGIDRIYRKFLLIDKKTEQPIGNYR